MTCRWIEPNWAFMDLEPTSVQKVSYKRCLCEGKVDFPVQMFQSRSLTFIVTKLEPKESNDGNDKLLEKNIRQGLQNIEISYGFSVRHKQYRKWKAIQKNMLSYFRNTSNTFQWIGINILFLLLLFLEDDPKSMRN